MRKNRNQVTQQDIAVASDVSQQLVSVIMRARGSVVPQCSDKTRNKVLAVAERLGYRPNRSARGLQGQCHAALGLLVRSLDYVPHAMLKAMLEQAKKLGLVLLIENLSLDGLRNITLLDEDCVDGLLIFQDMPEMIVKCIDRLRIPAVWVNTNLHDRPGSIIFSEQEAADSAVEAFATKRRRRVACITNIVIDRPHYCDRDRFHGLCSACRRRGLEPPPRLEFTFEHPAQQQEAITRSILRFLGDHPKLDALVLQGDVLAPAVYAALRQTGREPGKDLSVIAFNNSDIAWSITPALCALAVDPRKTAACAVARLVTLIQGQDPGPVPMVMPYHLVERPSL